MVTLLVPTITIHSAANGAIVQTAKVTDKCEKAKLMAAVSGVAQYVTVFSFGQTLDFEVTGHGDLTMTSGLGQSIDLSLVASGQSIVDQFEYEQTVNAPSKWSYKGENLPFGSVLT